MIALRDYQTAAVDALFDYWDNARSGLIIAPCGAGKSLIIAEIIRRARQWPDTRIIILTHRKKLLEQNESELRNILPDAPTGFYSAGLKRKDKQAQILFAGIQSVHKMATKLEPFDMILIDEAHMMPRSSETQYGRFIAEALLVNPRLKIAGLTATPYRLDSGRLTDKPGNVFDKEVYDISVKMLIDRGYLCPVVSKGAAKPVNMSKVHRRGGEFIASEMAAAFDQADIVQEACREIVAYGHDRRAWLVFAASIEHAEHVRDTLQEMGIDAKTYTSADADESVLDDFAHGRLRCVVNVDILTVGSNFPICDMMAILRATESTALYVQIVGRGMRLYPGKENCLLLDYGGNVERHGVIDDVVVAKNPEGSGEGKAPVKTCENCHSLVHAAVRECPDCGFLFPVEEANHDTIAYSGALLRSQIQPTVHEVTSWSWTRHVKPGKPDSVKVTYQCGLMRRFSEWICPEHGGLAERMAKKFARSVFDDDDLIDHLTTDAMLDFFKEAFQPSHIEVTPDGKYERVTRRIYTHQGADKAA